MALYPDGPPSSLEDLTAQDSQLLDVANVEGINLQQKVQLAYEELGNEIYSLLNRMLPAVSLPWASVRPTLAAVAVTPPLKRWHTYRALELVYADAYNSQLNDRYSGKRAQFHDLAKASYDKLIEAGLGMVEDPVPMPAKPTLSEAPGALADNLYYACTTWLNRAGEEGAPSPHSSIITSGCTFSITAEAASTGPVGWNVYGGTDADALIQQNPTPLAIGATWIQPDTMVQHGRKPGRGQAPTYHRQVPRLMQRG
jgi:hypothetical protein